MTNEYLEYVGWRTETNQKVCDLRLRMETHRDTIRAALSLLVDIEENDAERAADAALRLADCSVRLRGLRAELAAKARQFGGDRRA